MRPFYLLSTGALAQRSLRYFSPLTCAQMVSITYPNTNGYSVIRVMSRPRLKVSTQPMKKKSSMRPVLSPFRSCRARIATHSAIKNGSPVKPKRSVFDSRRPKASHPSGCMAQSSSRPPSRLVHRPAASTPKNGPKFVTPCRSPVKAAGYFHRPIIPHTPTPASPSFWSP